MNLEQKIRSVIREALGVPSNIYETANEIFDKLLRATKKLNKEDFENYGAHMKFRGEFTIADFPFSSVKFQLGIEENKRAKEPELVSMVIRSESKKDGGKLIPVKTKTLDLLAVYVVPKGYDYSQFPNFLLSDKKQAVESLTHELKHAYDHFKKPLDSGEARASYQSIVGKQFGVPSLDRFFHDIYFISENENLVRPSEISAAIRNNEISQKDFLNFLKSHETYLNLKRISNFSLAKLKQDLKKEMKSIDRVLKHVGLPVDEMSETKKINEVLKLAYVNVTNWKIEAYKDMLTSSFFEELLGFEGEKEKLFRKFVNKSHNFTGYKDFFQYYERYFHQIANEVIKKIAKLYAITKPNV